MADSDDPEQMHGEAGLSGEEDQPEDTDEESEPLDDIPNPPKDEMHATVVAFVARRQLNTIDTKPGGYAWFSA